MSKEDRRYRLRPSVSIIPTKDEMVWEFFQSNTRRIRHIKVADNFLIDAVKTLNGNTISKLLEQHGEHSNISNFVSHLYQSCLIEDYDLSAHINSNPFNRVINFIADYFPTHEAFEKFNKIRNSHVLIVGVGAVGSWIAHLLAQTGVASFTLCDPDIVRPGNLNRSLFFFDDIGKQKTSCIERLLHKIDPTISVNISDSLVQSTLDVLNIINSSKSDVDLVINASDIPNVDTTSEYIAKACMERRIPHIIAGGYNLHLSLIGPTIIPYRTPCFKCIKYGLENGKPDEFSRVRKMHREKRNIGNLSPLAGISASFAVFEAIRVFISSEDLFPIMAGRRGEFNFLTSKLSFSEYPRVPKCSWCGNENNA